jgi:hypothetical protein
MVKEKFKDVPFGDPQVGHVSPTGIDYEAVSLNENGTMNGVMKEMVDVIIGILEWNDANVMMKTSFTMGISRQECSSVLTNGRRKQQIRRRMDQMRQNILKVLQN